MLTWDIESIICATVEALLPTFSVPNKGLKITLEINLSTHSDEDSFYATRYLELVFQRPTNYTKVFSRITNRKDEVIRDWKNTSNHDSCWKSDGLRDLFQCYIAVRDEMDELNLGWDKKEHPSEISISNSVFKKYLQFGEVVIEKDPEDSYHYRLVSFTPDNTKP